MQLALLLTLLILSCLFLTSDTKATQQLNQRKALGNKRLIKPSRMDSRYLDLKSDTVRSKRIRKLILEEGPYRYTPFDWEKNGCSYARCGPLDNCTGLRGWTGERFEEMEVCKCLSPNYIVGTTCAAPIPADILNPCLNETNNNCDPNFTICIHNPFPMGYSILEGEVMYAYYVCECNEGFESTQCWKSRIANASFLHPCDERTNCLPFWTGNWPGGLGNCYKDTCSCRILESCKSNRECCSGKCVEGKCAKGKLNDFCYMGSCAEGLQCEGGWDPASEERDYYALCK